MSKKWEHHELEDNYLSQEKREGRQDRKIARSKDRSKYKKTDRGKIEREKKLKSDKLFEKEKLVRGRVLSIGSEGHFVDVEGKVYSCTLKGVLKKEKTEAKNLVVVGDFVHFLPLEGNEGSIAHVEERKTVLSRADNLDQRKEQLIAANIDQVLITSSLINPIIKPSLIDRYIIATLQGKMEPVIILNKMDLIESDPHEKELVEQIVEEYTPFGWKVICTSCEKNLGLDELREVMKGKASVFSGQSGVGKSSLINAVTGFNLKVGKTVEKTRKGAHTTTTASLIQLPFGGWCIDTPGIKSFGIWKLDKEEIVNYFFDFSKINCRFPGCTHTHEPFCDVKALVEKGEYSPIRYESYLALVDELEGKHQRR